MWSFRPLTSTEQPWLVSTLEFSQRQDDKSNLVSLSAGIELLMFNGTNVNLLENI
jgi:hypothetical protein